LCRSCDPSALLRTEGLAEAQTALRQAQGKRWIYVFWGATLQHFQACLEGAESWSQFVPKMYKNEILFSKMLNFVKKRQQAIDFFSEHCWVGLARKVMNLNLLYIASQGKSNYDGRYRNLSHNPFFRNYSGTD
jgi:hypothetical protein